MCLYLCVSTWLSGLEVLVRWDSKSKLLLIQLQIRLTYNVSDSVFLLVHESLKIDVIAITRSPIVSIGHAPSDIRHQVPHTHKFGEWTDILQIGLHWSK